MHDGDSGDNEYKYVRTYGEIEGRRTIDVVVGAVTVQYMAVKIIWYCSTIIIVPCTNIYIGGSRRYDTIRYDRK